MDKEFKVDYSFTSDQVDILLEALKVYADAATFQTTRDEIFGIIGYLEDTWVENA